MYITEAVIHICMGGHNEIPCVAIIISNYLNTTFYVFFFYKIREQEGGTGPGGGGMR
jgi:hypothetical protein